VATLSVHRPRGGGVALGVRPWQVTARRALIGAAYASALALTAYSAILAKEARHAPALLEVTRVPLATPAISEPPITFGEEPTPYAAAVTLAETPGGALEVDTNAVAVAAGTPAADAPAADAVHSSQPVARPSAPEARRWPVDTRWFNGRPVRPARKMWMTVTAYSPDARSCGDSADGITSTLHHVTTNDHTLVAADPRLLPMGSMLTIEGYDDGNIVPVLDVGGAIKGRRLDVLFPTHEQAKKFGVRRILVTVWEYADGKPRDNPRQLRW
jgi:3D (Asp-Asp-Asp) domain-containing protein